MSILGNKKNTSPSSFNIVILVSLWTYCCYRHFPTDCTICEIIWSSILTQCACSTTTSQGITETYITMEVGLLCIVVLYKCQLVVYNIVDTRMGSQSYLSPVFVGRLWDLIFGIHIWICFINHNYIQICFKIYRLWILSYTRAGH